MPANTTQWDAPVADAGFELHARGYVPFMGEMDRTEPTGNAPSGGPPARVAVMDLDAPIPEVLDRIAQCFGIYDDAVEDAMEPHQRPRLQWHEDLMSLVLKTTEFDDPRESVDFGEIQVLASHDFVVSVRRGGACGRAPTKDHVDRERSIGPIAVVHRLVEDVVDEHEPALNIIEHEVVEIERSVCSPEKRNADEEIHRLKRHVGEIRRNVVSLADPIDTLATGATPWDDRQLHARFCGTKVRLRRLRGRIEDLDTRLGDALLANLAHATARASDALRIIAAFAAVLAVTTIVLLLWP